MGISPRTTTDRIPTTISRRRIPIPTAMGDIPMAGDRPIPALPIPMVPVLPMEVRHIPTAPDQHPGDLLLVPVIPTERDQRPVRGVPRDRVIPTAPVQQADRQTPVLLQADHRIPTAPDRLRGVLRRPADRLQRADHPDQPADRLPRDQVLPVRLQQADLLRPAQARLPKITPMALLMHWRLPKQPPALRWLT